MHGILLLFVFASLAFAADPLLEVPKVPQTPRSPGNSLTPITPVSPTTPLAPINPINDPAAVRAMERELRASIKHPTPPTRPYVDYPVANIREISGGTGAQRYWIFEPEIPAAAPAPLVIFFHGYSVLNPDPYREWIRHIVRQGRIVIYPQYQEDLLTLPVDYHANSRAAILAALQELESPGHTKPDLSRVALVGHSAGGIGALTFAARAAVDKLPAAKAIMAVHPGQGLKNGLQIIPLDDYTKIPGTTRIQLLVGEDDGFVGDTSAKRIWKQTNQVRDRALLTIPSDSHGWPPLLSDHLAPLAINPSSTDALDWLAYWRTFDQLCSDAFANKTMVIETDMLRWSDGQPVKPIKVQSSHL